MSNSDIYFNIKDILNKLSVKESVDYEKVNGDLIRVASNASSRYKNGNKVGQLVRYKTDTKYILIYSNDPNYDNVTDICNHKDNFNFIDGDTYSYYEIKKYTLFVLGGLVVWDGSYTEPKNTDSWGRALDRDRSRDNSNGIPY